MQLILSPANGWEEVSYDNTEPDVLAADGMYPLMGLAACTAFIQGLYDGPYDVGVVLQRALVDFISLLVTYLMGGALLEHFINNFSTTDVSVKKCRTVAVYMTALLCLVQIVENLVPVEFTVIKFLPALAAIVLWRAKSYLTIDAEKEGLYILFSIGVIIVPWFVLTTVLGIFI